jgi:hypothetical protein
MEDLTELALSALDADTSDSGGEASDNSETNSEPADTGQEPENTPSDEKEETSSEPEEDNKGDNGSRDDSEATTDSDNSDDTDGSSDGKESSEKLEEKKEEKKEPSDEEFEEMAKKRGYAKAPSEEEKKQAETAQQTEERLTKRPKEVPEEVWENTPKNNRMVYNSLPIVTARGKNGTTVNVKLPTQLPDGFEFADEKARTEFMTAMAEQGKRSDEWLNALDARDKQMEADNQRIAFAKQTIAEVQALQKTGALPTPKAKPNTPEFKDDPAVKILDGVVGLRDQKLAAGYNISIEDAAALYKVQHPEMFEKKNAYNEKADAERGGVARKVATGKKTSGRGADNYNQTPVYRPGSNMSLQDVAEEAMRREGIIE